MLNKTGKIKLVKLIAYYQSSFKQKHFLLVVHGRWERFYMQAEGESLLTLPFNLGEVWSLFFPVV